MNFSRRQNNQDANSKAASTKLIMMFGLLAIGNCIGCSLQSGESLESLQTNATPFSDVLANATNKLTEADLADMSEIPTGKQIAKTEMPSPGRVNAFELSDDFQSETPVQESAGKREIYVLGFVEVDDPSVMLSIDGRTQVLKAGDTIDRITVQEIVPPRARLSSDGVSWNASIFDRRSSVSDVAARKK